MEDEAYEETWLKVRDALRKLRGQNQFRGREMHLPKQRLVVIPAELRGEANQEHGLLIHLTPDEHELWAEVKPTGEKFHIRDYSVDINAFMSALIQHMRGDAYMHTNSEKGSYREQL